MSEDWTLDEVEAVVGDYFAMLDEEHRGVAYSKTAHRNRLAPRLNGRSDGSIEFKHANISAVMVGYGLPYIDGYKPRGNYQRLLAQVVLEYLTANPDFLPRLASSQVVDPASLVVAPARFADVLETPPDPAVLTPLVWSPTQRTVKIDFVRRDAENARLGRLGEEFVLELERRRLHDDAERPDLARRVEWTADVRGDGAGYDIASFNQDGSARLIEVKTTGLGKAFPFYVTANEVRCSDAVPHD
jgi:hypothetical protein